MSREHCSAHRTYTVTESLQGAFDLLVSATSTCCAFTFTIHLLYQLKLVLLVLYH